MAWKPLHEAHAIDRVRILVQFDAQLSDKTLARAAGPITATAFDLGFGTVERAGSSVQEINITPGMQAGFPAPPRANGWVLKRQDGQRLVEEAGYRDLVFGYMTSEYSRWENMRSRFWDLFDQPLRSAMDAVSVGRSALSIGTSLYSMDRRKRRMPVISLANWMQRCLPVMCKVVDCGIPIRDGSSRGMRCPY